MDKTETKQACDIALAQEEKIAFSILNGARTADVAAVNKIKYASCREILHKYCRRVNPDAYERINIDAANKDCQSPFLDQLRHNKHLFIRQAEPRDPEFLKREIAQQEESFTQAQISLRSTRTVLDQLEAELAAATQRKAHQ